MWQRSYRIVFFSLPTVNFLPFFSGWVHKKYVKITSFMSILFQKCINWSYFLKNGNFGTHAIAVTFLCFLHKTQISFWWYIAVRLRCTADIILNSYVHICLFMAKQFCSMKHPFLKFNCVPLSFFLRRALKFCVCDTWDSIYAFPSHFLSRNCF